MAEDDRRLLVDTLQSVLGEGEVSDKGREILGFDDESEFSRFLDGGRALVRIGEFLPAARPRVKG